jgi:ubiquinone/menaquinone biosynthesis C-methylase UbiE
LPQVSQQLPDHRRVAEYYDTQYHALAKAGAPGREFYRLARLLDVQPGARVLDIACGTGEWLAALAGLGAVVTGIDISARAIEVCRKRLAEGCFEVGVAEDLPFPGACFDLVTCMGSLEHFLDQPGALREMVRVVRPGGRVLVLVPNSGFLPYRTGLYRGTQQQAIRETVRSLPEWHKMLADAGLTVETRWRDLHVLDAGWIMRAPWWMVPLRLLLAIQLPIWPMGWQYQVHFVCRFPAGREDG